MPNLADPEPGQSDRAQPQRIALDLVPTRLIVPKLRVVAVVAGVVGVLVAFVASIFVSWPIAAVIGLAVGAPTVISALLGMRGRIWMSDRTVVARRPFGTRRIDVARTVTAELVVRTARINQVGLRIGDGRATVSVPLALYTDDGGRELDLVALRRLADALSSSELAAAASVASVLVQQLRAEALDAGLEARPLYRAVRLVRDAGRPQQTTLTDAEVASLY